MKTKEYKITEIVAGDIDLSDSRFRISRPLLNDKISRAISRFGILYFPLVVKSGDKYILASGHNVFEAAGLKSSIRIGSIVIDKYDSDLFIRESIRMVLNGEVGPVGKLKALFILSEYFRIEDSQIYWIGRNGYSIPDDFINRGELLQKLAELPDELKEYIDIREISFKSIRSLLKLSENQLYLLKGFVSKFNIRVNVFRDLVDMLSDIDRGGIDSDSLKKLTREEITDPRQFEKFIHDAVYRLRYPDYAGMKKTADKLVSGMNSESIEIEYPEYFEKNLLKLNVNIKKNDDVDEICRRFEGLVKSERFRELLDML